MMNDYLDVDLMELQIEDDLEIENKKLKRRKDIKIETKLVCRDFSEEIFELVFYYQHKTKHYGRCLVKKGEGKKKTRVCDICGKKIKGDYYYPALWDRLIGHSFCVDCYMESIRDWVWD